MLVLRGVPYLHPTKLAWNTMEHNYGGLEDDFRVQMGDL